MTLTNADRVRKWRAENRERHAANQRAYRKRQCERLAEAAELERLLEEVLAENDKLRATNKQLKERVRELEKASKRR